MKALYDLVMPDGTQDLEFDSWVTGSKNQWSTVEGHPCLFGDPLRDEEKVGGWVINCATPARTSPSTRYVRPPGPLTQATFTSFYITMSYKESIVQCEEGSIHREGMSETEDGSRFNGSEELEIEKKVLHKIDIRNVPILGLLYTTSLVDRSNISVARISGLDEDVDLDKGNRASIALLVFFIGFISFEIPSSIVIQSVGVANWIAGITFAWGLVTLGIGLLSNWVGLAICRAVLGIFEAGFYPGYDVRINLLNANLMMADVSI